MNSHDNYLENPYIDPLAYRNAMTRLGAAVHVVTTNGVGGQAGFTASAVCSVTDSPATLLVCLQHTSSAYAAFKKNGVLCVNTLGSALEHVARKFGGKTPMEERFAGIDWKTLLTGAPMHPEALVAFDCQVERHVDVSTHDVLFCRVQAIYQPEPALDDACLIYAGRQYHSVPLLDN